MHLHGRKVVVVKTKEYTHYYLCHSTEQATIRQIVECYEYREDIHPLVCRLEFLRLFAARQYMEAVAYFDKNCNEVEITNEDFAADEAFVNQGDLMDEIKLAIVSEVEELTKIVNATTPVAEEDAFAEESDKNMED